MEKSGYADARRSDRYATRAPPATPRVCGVCVDVWTTANPPVYRGFSSSRIPSNGACRAGVRNPPTLHPDPPHSSVCETKAKCTDGDAITKRSPRMTDVPSAMRRHGILNLQDRHCSGLPKHSPLQYSHHFFVVHDMERLMVPPDDFLSNDIDRRIACIAFIGVATGTTFFSGRRISTT